MANKYNIMNNHSLYLELARNSQADKYGKSKVLEVDDIFLVRFSNHGGNTEVDSKIKTETHTDSKLKNR